MLAGAFASVCFRAKRWNPNPCTSMSYSYEIVPDRELTILTLSGEVTGDTIIEALRTLIDDPA